MNDPKSGLNAVAEAAKQAPGKGLPPVHLWHPEHCGEIDIRSRVGHGTRVSVYLPASEPSRQLFGRELPGSLELQQDGPTLATLARNMGVVAR